MQQSTKSTPRCPECKRLNEQLGWRWGKVLVVIHGDGAIQHYATNARDIHVAYMPTVAHRENEIAAEALFEIRLPKDFRALYEPRFLRTTNTVRAVSAADLIRLDADNELLKAISTLSGDAQAVSKAKGGRRVWTA